MGKKTKDMQAEVRESARKIWLAGLGAMAVAGEEGKTLFRSLVEKGEEYESRGRGRMDKVKGKLQDARTNASLVLDQVQARVDDQVSGALQRLGVPSRKEIAGLTKRVEELTKALDKMKAKGSAAPRARKPSAKKAAAKPASPKAAAPATAAPAEEPKSAE
jgi:poly(hydroxyalkanoate) granule-associated protein